MSGPIVLMTLAKAGAVAGPFLAFAVFWLLKRAGARRTAWVYSSIITLFWALGVWAFLIEPNTLAVRHVTVVSPQWKGEPVRIGVITDTHVGAPHVDVARVIRVVARMNAENPDIVVLLGDYAGGHEPAVLRADPARSAVLRGIAAFKGLNPPLGTVAIMGNHDAWYDEDATAKALLAAGAKLAENDAVEVVRPRDRFWVAGLADLESERKRTSIDKALEPVPPDAPVILLTHFPDPFGSVPPRVALTLAGHTHCGQVNLPLVGRLIPASPASRIWPCGLYSVGGRQLYVSGGIGVSILPVRFRAPPEINIVTLKSEPLLAPKALSH